MIFDWYKLFNKEEFEDTELVSRLLSVYLVDVGQREFLITKGIGVNVIYDGVFLPVQFSGANPYSRDGYALYLDEETQDVYFGIEVEEG